MKKAAGLLRLGEQDSMAVVGLVFARKAEHSIKVMCRVLQVSRSGYHAWAARPPSPFTVADTRLSARIGELHALRRGVYGPPRIWRTSSWTTVTERAQRVERLMREAACRADHKKYRSTTLRVCRA